MKKPASLRAVEWLNFFLADVQTGLGPFLAAYLAASGWNPGRVGYALTFGGLVTVAMQTPAGALVDAVHSKRALLAISLGVLVGGAFLLMAPLTVFSVYSAQVLIGGAAPFLAPTVAAITLGIVGAKGFDRQFGRNQSFNSAGNVFAAVLIAYVSYTFGYRTIFVVAALLAIPPRFLSLPSMQSKLTMRARAAPRAKAINRKPKDSGLFSKIALCSSFWQPHSCSIYRTRPCCRNWASCWLMEIQKPPLPSCPRASS